MPTGVKNKEIKDFIKDESIIVGPVQRFVKARGLDPDDEERRQDVIHPSELSRDDFCPRAVYYRIAGYEQVEPTPTNSFALRQIMSEGTDIHRKWQRDLWDMGDLVGKFGCLYCRQAREDSDDRTIEWTWWDRSPSHCPVCDFPRQFLVYLEVPIHDEQHLLLGHSDGQVGDDLLEIKSVGEGSVRIEAPQLYNRYVKTVVLDGEEIQWVDLKGIWRAIKRPFLTHLRQGQLYLHATGRERIIFIYEGKWNQQFKEFVVKYNPRIVEPMLETCKDIKWALENNLAPYCPHGGCSYCRSYEGDKGAPHRGHVANAGGSDDGRQGRARKEGLQAAGKTLKRPSQAAKKAVGDNRRRADGSLHRTNKVERPYRRVLGTPGGRREVRRGGI